LSKSYKKPKKSRKQAIMSDKTKKTSLVLVLGIAVLAGGFWTYRQLTTLSPPDLNTSKSDDVTQYLGNVRGFSRLPVARRETYLNQLYQRYSSGQPRADLNRSLRRMTAGERMVFLNAFAEVGRVQLLRQANEFNKLAPSQRASFVDKAIRDFEGTKGSLNGAGRGDSFGNPFSGDLPTSSDEISKRLVSMTSPSQRAHAKPFVDAVAQRYKDLEDPSERRRFDAGS